MFTIECFKDEWCVIGSADSLGAAAEAFDEACARNEGYALILRGEMGEVMAKRSVYPVDESGESDGS